MKNELKKRLRKEELRAAIFQDVALSFVRSSTLRVILADILGRINSFFRSDASSIILKDDERQKLYFYLARGKKSRTVVKHDLRLGEGICGWVIERNKPLLSQDPYKDRRFKREIDLAIDFQTRGIICVPLPSARVSGKSVAIGALEIVNSRAGREFTASDLAFLSALAGQISIMLQYNRLVGQLRDKVDELSSLIRVSETVGSTLDLNELLDRVMGEAKRVMKAEASSLMLIDEATGDLVFHSVRGAKRGRVREMRVPAGKGVAGWIARHGKPCIVNDVARDPRFYGQTDRKTSFKTRQIVGVPLAVRGKILGVVEAVNSLGKSGFDKADARLFLAMARLSALSLQNAKFFSESKELFVSVISSLAMALDAKDPYTQGHSERVTQYAILIAEDLGLDGEERKNIQFAGLLHDVGKIGIADGILRKPGKLTDEEFGAIRTHPATGERIMRQIREFEKILPGIRSHHERFDGRGYPDSLKEGRIPLAGRILAVADTFDAMTSDRPYRKRMETRLAVEEITRCSGTQFDPEVVRSFVRMQEAGLLAPIVESQKAAVRKDRPEGGPDENPGT